MKRCSVKYDQKVQKELVFKMWVFGLTCGIVGSLGLVAYMILGFYFSGLWLDCMLLTMFILFTAGLAIVISINLTGKSATKSDCVNNIEINENSIMLNVLKDNKLMVSVNILYKNLYKFKETKNYFFLFLTKDKVIPILKKDFKSEERSMIKLWICGEMFKEKANKT